MLIQRDKAAFMDITFNVTYFDFEDDFLISTDKQRLQQVLMNLQSNALKFTPRGGFVILRCRKINGNVEVTVTDNGCGIRDEDKSKLFKLFGFLEANQELNTQGTGLGLHISHLITKKFGGDIWFHSQSGSGS